MKTLMISFITMLFAGFSFYTQPEKPKEFEQLLWGTYDYISVPGGTIEMCTGEFTDCTSNDGDIDVIPR
ncbi:MAG: hypothetical protein ACI83B_003602 [Sediminicola sp.]|jgi:hypothetical protein